MKISKSLFALSLIYAVVAIFWFVFVIVSGHSGIYDGPVFKYLVKPFLVGMTLLPLIGGFIGLKKAKKWGSIKSAVGRSITALSLGLFGWGFGMIVWNYYLFIGQVEVPYPSLADLFYISIWPLWTYAMFQLSKATGVKFGLKSKKGKIFFFVVPILIVVLSYYLLFTIARGNTLEWNNMVQLILGILYPLGDVAILISAVMVFILSIRFLGGRYRQPVRILLLGFVLNYVTDFIFVYTTTNGTYFNAHVADFLYVNMLFIISLGVVLFDPDRLDIDIKKSNM